MRIGTLANNSMACATAAPGSAMYVQYGCGPDVAPDVAACPSGMQLDPSGMVCVPAGGGGSGQSATPNPANYPNYAAEYQQATGGSTCPPGTDLYQGAVCLPLSSPAWKQIPVNTKPTIIPGVPDWALYAVGGVLALIVLKNQMGR